MNNGPNNNTYASAGLSIVFKYVGAGLHFQTFQTLSLVKILLLPDITLFDSKTAWEGSIRHYRPHGDEQQILDAVQ